MIYRPLRNRLLTLLKAPTGPPDPPIGSSESVQVFRAAPNFLKYRIIKWGLAFASGLVGTVVLAFYGTWFGGDDSTSGSLWIGIALFVLTLLGAAVKYVLVRLDYDMRYYVVTDRSLRIREGAVLIHEATFTFANVQNLKIHQGPLERLLGISNLEVETAGGSAGKTDRGKGPGAFPGMRGHQGVFRGIHNAPEVRDQILELLKQYRDSGLGDPEDRRRAAGHRRAQPALSPVVVDRLREVRDEMRGLAHAVQSGS